MIPCREIVSPNWKLKVHAPHRNILVYSPVTVLPETVANAIIAKKIMHSTEKFSIPVW